MTTPTRQGAVVNKIYAFVNGEWGSDLVGVAIAEDGMVLAQHVSSSESWVWHDLGVGSTRQHDHYAEHYPNGFEVEYVPMEQRDSHAGLQAALAANRTLAAARAAATEPTACTD